MSYIKCKSFISNKEVQYGLIDVKLKHNILQQDYGTINTSSTTYWNTSPELLGTLKQTLNNNNNLYETSNAMKIAGITGLSNQGYSASGILDSEYTYVRSGKQPIISNIVFDIENMNEGYNQFDLFETDNIKVILECLKVKASKLYISSSANYSFRELDGTYTEDPYVIADCVIKQILKSSNTIIGEYSYIYNIADEVFPIKFSLNTEIFRIINFDPSYYTQYYYSSRYNLWLDDGCTQNNKLYNNGDFVNGKGDFVGIAVSVYMGDYWYATRNYYNMNRRQVSSSDNVIVSDNLIRSFNNTAQNSFYNHNINNNPNEFIIFGVPSIGNSYITTSQEAIDLANSTINSESKYHTKGYDFIDTNIVNPWNFILSPIMAPIVTTTYEEISKGTSGVFIPLTNTVFEGDPEKPDEPETTEPADNPDTDYTPEVSDGEEDYVIPDSDVITGIPGATNAFGTSFANYIFRRWRYTDITSADSYNIDIAQSFFNDANSLVTINPIRDLFVFKNDYPKLSDLVSRVYYLPFEYDEIVQQNSYQETTPYIKYIGPVLYSYTKSGMNWSISETSYYKQFRNRYVILDLGTKVIQKVFNNFLDYTTEYTLNLPYGAGQYNIEPSRLFNNGQSGTIKIIGYLDIDLGILILKVIINEQLVYETSVNIACDISVGSYDEKIAIELIKLPMQIGLQAGRLISNPQGFIKSKLYSDDARDRELKERRVTVSERNAETNRQHLDVMKERNELMSKQISLLEDINKKNKKKGSD